MAWYDYSPENAPAEEAKALLEKVINNARGCVREVTAPSLACWMACYGGDATCWLLGYYGKRLENAISECLNATKTRG